MQDSMTSILNNENAKENSEPIGDDEAESEGPPPRDNVMNAASKLPTNGGQLSRVIPENPRVNTVENMHIPSDQSPIYTDKSANTRSKRLTNSLERGNTEKALLNFNN